MFSKRFTFANNQVLSARKPREMAGEEDAGAAAMNAAALARRQALAGPSGPAGLVQNMKVFGIAMFACLGGYVISLQTPRLFVVNVLTYRG